MTVPLYPAEAGLELDDASGRLTVFGGVVRPSLLPARPAADASADADDPTLRRLNTLVVSTGFNLNGHFFPSDDLWAAKGTAANKPFNLEHQKDDIIGHALRAWPVDAALAPLDPAAAPPAAFHVMDESVIYLYRPTERGEALAQTLEDLERGLYWVSMECLFADFDYAVGHSPTGKFTDVAEPQLIKRTAKTAHLTQYLRTVKRADGTRGPGRLPDGRLIGQALRDITFVGKGLVKVPANPASAVYLPDGTLLSGVLPAAEGSLPAPVYTPPVTTTEPAMTLEQALAEVSKLNAEVAIAKATLDAAAKTKDELEAGHAAALAALRDELDKTKTDLGEAQKLLSDAADAQRLADRAGKLAVALKLDEEKAVALATALKPLTDEAFAAHLDLVKPLTTPTAPPAKPDLPAQATITPDAPAAPPTTPTTPPAPKGDRQKAAKGLFTKYRSN